MGNVTINKPTTANNMFAPFAPSRAVDSVISAANRWVSSEVPAYLQVDLQGLCWINQYTANFMGSVNWPSNYNLSDFKVQSSMDGSNWTDIETFTGNTANQLNRTVTPRQAKFLRVYITKGLTCNNGVASIVDFQAFEPANAPFLSNLVPSTGTLSPVFSTRALNYSMNVANTVNTIKFTPTALNGGTIKVNGTAVTSGQQSTDITLNVGSNLVPVEVTSSDNTMKTTYNITVVRAGVAAFLSALSLRTDRNQPVAYTPALSDSVLSYSASVGSGVAAIIVTPSASNATILVNGTQVTSGGDSPKITLVSGANSISIQVSPSGGGSTTNYTLIVTKG